MNANITGSASAGAVIGGRCRLSIGAAIVVDLREGQSSAFGATLANIGDKLTPDRFKAGDTTNAGASATGSISVDNTADTVRGCKVVFKPNGGTAEVLADIAPGSTGGASFTFAQQGDELSVEHA